jgi:hypothetical protein
MGRLLLVAGLAMSLAGVGCSDPDSKGNRLGGAAGTVAGSGGTGAGSGSGGAGGSYNPDPVAGTISINPMGGMGGDGGSAGGTPSNIEPFFLDECGPGNAAGLSDADVAALQAGSAGAGRILYPYDGTVFPRGLLAPTWMWDGGQADAVYIHIKSSLFEYKGCLTPTGMNQLTLPQTLWDTAGSKTRGPSDPFVITMTTRAGGAVTGPMTQQVVIAQATIKGSIFYNSYSSALPGGLGGSVLRIPPGGTAEKFIAIECNGCHSLSANGERLLTQSFVTTGQSFQITPTSTPNPPAMITAPRGAYGALTPDGSVFLSTSNVMGVARAGIAQGVGAPAESLLYETDTGTEIPGTGIPTTALMPMFSPNGTLLAFNDFAAGAGKSLSLMDYDAGNRKASGLRVIFEETDAALRPGWPFFLPDNGGIVFVRTDGADFSGDGAGLIPLPIGPTSDLYMLDVKTGTHTMMARAMGFATPADAMSGTSYLSGPDELHKNYFPTVSPVAAGGYFWVFFDSLRNYGNQGLQRQLWGAAVEISPTGDYSVDRSAPAYYLPGQEFGTGNHRAFAALDPCKMDGNDCTSGTDCCGGFCFVPEKANEEFAEEPVGKCTHDVPMCSNTNDRCSVDADCCAPEDATQTPNTCINGFCAKLLSPQ